MGMKNMPDVFKLKSGGKFWSYTFNLFKVKVYVPDCAPIAEHVNFGFAAPYLLVFEEKELDMASAVEFADSQGFTAIAKKYCTSVVFVYPTCEGGWDNAPAELFSDLIAESRINQYYKDGIVTPKSWFGKPSENFIRGAIFRTCLYGYGKSADFIAENYLKTIHGQYLWGPGEITPAVVTLEKLSVIPSPERRDIPVVSVSNSDEINAALTLTCDHLLIRGHSDVLRDFTEFVSKYKRWCGVLTPEPDMTALGMIEEAGTVTVCTSADNCGDDRDTDEHVIGYMAYYNKELFSSGPVPLLLAFHGGGDSALYISHVSGWYRIAHKYNFLLVAVENHLNSTASEMIEFIEKLKEKYPIDISRIYASGFSMGGCKSWDLYQEYPSVFAALAPMSATFEVGLNCYGRPAPAEINRNTPVPLFYAGGEITPLPELPFQAEKCHDRIRYVFDVNRCVKKYDVKFEDRDHWENPVWGISGDTVEKIDDPSRGSVLTIHFFESEDGIVRTALASISGQGHECREHTCEHAWKFMSQFTRSAE